MGFAFELAGGGGIAHGSGAKAEDLARGEEGEEGARAWLREVEHGPFVGEEAL